jgi:carbon monoxide dehydrogenase subunit G
MTVKELISKLSKLDPNMTVLSEYDMDGDEFMVKVMIDKVYVGDGFDDSYCEDDDVDEDEKFCIIKLSV